MKSAPPSKINLFHLPFDGSLERPLQSVTTKTKMKILSPRMTMMTMMKTMCLFPRRKEVEVASSKEVEVELVSLAKTESKLRSASSNECKNDTLSKFWHFSLARTFPLLSPFNSCLGNCLLWVDPDHKL